MGNNFKVDVNDWIDKLVATGELAEADAKGLKTLAANEKAARFISDSVLDHENFRRQSAADAEERRKFEEDKSRIYRWYQERLSEDHNNAEAMTKIEAERQRYIQEYGELPIDDDAQGKLPPDRRGKPNGHAVVDPDELRKEFKGSVDQIQNYGVKLMGKMTNYVHRHIQEFGVKDAVDWDALLEKARTEGKDFDSVYSDHVAEKRRTKNEAEIQARIDSKVKEETDKLRSQMSIPSPNSLPAGVVPSALEARASMSDDERKVPASKRAFSDWIQGKFPRGESRAE